MRIQNLNNSNIRTNEYIIPNDQILNNANFNFPQRRPITGQPFLNNNQRLNSLETIMASLQSSMQSITSALTKLTSLLTQNQGASTSVQTAVPTDISNQVGIENSQAQGEIAQPSLADLGKELLGSLFDGSFTTKLPQIVDSVISILSKKANTFFGDKASSLVSSLLGKGKDMLSNLLGGGNGISSLLSGILGKGGSALTGLISGGKSMLLGLTGGLTGIGTAIGGPIGGAIATGISLISETKIGKKIGSGIEKAFKKIF